MTSPPIAGETTVTAPSGRTFAARACSELLDDRHLLKRQGALEELPAVQAAAQNEMAFEQGAGLAEQGQGFFVRHGGG